MALVIKDRVRQATTTTGTGTVTLSGSATGFDSFSVIGDGNTTYYTIVDNTTGDWEVGIGTYTASGTTLSRDTVLASSNSGLLVNFSAGTKDVWGDYPAGKAVTTDTLAYPPVIGNTTPNAATFTTLKTTGQADLGGDASNPSLKANAISGVTRWIEATGAVGSNPLLSSWSTGSATGLNFGTRGAADFEFRTGSNSFRQFNIAHTASAVNYVQVTGNATGAGPIISAQGSDANVDLLYSAKGTGGSHVFRTNTTVRQFQVNHVTSAVNYATVTGSATNQDPIWGVAGTDTNISMVFQSKGTGGISLSTGSTGTSLVNGTSVTAITATVSGTNYTSIPSVAISAPTTAGGVQATANALMFTSGATVQSGGTGYTNGDVLTIVGGTTGGVVGTYTVTGVSGGVITSVSRTSGNGYSALPSNPVSTTGGTGTGATLNLTWNVNAFTITNAGSGYVEQPTVTFSGGGGSGAAAYATVGSGTTLRSLGSSMSFVTPAGEVVRIADGSGSIGNYTQFANTTGGDASITSTGASTNVSLFIGTKGSGSAIRFTTNAVASNEQLRVSHTASAVNYVQVTGAATGSGPTISSQGSDTNADLRLSTKGTGWYSFFANNSGFQVFQIQTVASGANWLRVSNSAAGFTPSISSTGSDTNIGLNLTTKGTGAVNVSNGGGQMFLVSSTGASPVNYVAVYGNTQSPEIRAEGSTAALDLQFLSKSTGSHMFYTSGTSYLKQFQVSHTASAVNYVQVTGAATGAGPTISVQGSDTNAFLAITSKGTSAIRLQTGGTSQVFINNISGAVNTLALSGSTTGNAVQIYAQGSDTDIPIVLQPKGTGALQAQANDGTATGGNARGANAVDWQTVRGASFQVASGQYSVVAGGTNNQVSGALSAISGGGFNAATGQYAVVSGGAANSASQYGAAIVGGQANGALGWFNFIGGGFTNSATSGTAVTTQGTTSVTSGSTAVTLSGSNANIKVGQLITGTGINTPTYVAAISGTSLTLSQNAASTGTPTLSFFTPHGVVVGGGNNQATGAYSFIGGGGDAGTAANRNTASGDWSFVGGGIRNTASGTASFVGGGGIAPAFGTFPNVASSTGSTVVGGFQNTSSNQGAFIGAGYLNTANGVYSAIVGGVGGSTRAITGNHVFPANDNPFSTNGGCQSALLVLARQTTDTTPTVLITSGTVASTTNQVILPNNAAYYFKGSVIANVTGAANGAAWSFEGAIMRGANAASTVLIDTPSVNRVAASSGATAWTVSVTADTTNGGLAVTVTGAAATTIRWVARLETTEVTF